MYQQNNEFEVWVNDRLGELRVKARLKSTLAFGNKIALVHYILALKKSTPITANKAKTIRHVTVPKATTPISLAVVRALDWYLKRMNSGSTEKP